jgi:6-phosphogluconate dehydrogenase
VPLPVISAALFARFASRQDSSPAMRAVAALRQQFGGHAVKSAAGPSGTPGEHAGPSSGTGSTQD